MIEVCYRIPVLAQSRVCRAASFAHFAVHNGAVFDLTLSGKGNTPPSFFLN